MTTYWSQLTDCRDSLTQKNIIIATSTQLMNISKAIANYTEYPAPIGAIRHKHSKQQNSTFSKNNKNEKLILLHYGMVERLIQTIKRRLAVLDFDPYLSNATLASRLANIIENIRLIPNSLTINHSKHTSAENQTLRYQTSQQKHHTTTSHTIT